MVLADAIFRQFKRPEGLLGRLVGWIMATRPSNRARNAWTVDLLQIAASDRVLELGCGPGLGLAAAARKATAGHVIGLDHSPTMLAQASARLADAIAAGRVDLRLGGIEALAREGGPFDRVFSVNVIQFLGDKRSALAALHAVTKPGGLLATTYQPRGRNPTREAALRMAAELRVAAEAVGFVDICVEELPLEPVPAVCVLARRPL